MASTCSSSSSKSTRNPGKGRRKIEIKEVEQPSKRLVTFSKRKLGLFRKTAELSLLCQSDTAVVIFSRQGKVFSFGHPDPDLVIHRYLSSGTSSSDPASVVGHDWEGESSGVSLLRKEYEEAMKVLDAEKKSLKAVAEIIPAGSGSANGSWWNRSVGDMGLEEVQEFKERLEQLRQNLVAAAEEKEEEMTTRTASVVTLPPPAEEEERLFMSMLNDDLGVAKNDQANWDWDWDSWIEGTSWNDSSSLVWNSDLGQSFTNSKDL